jgi:hypothetical protein
MNRFLCNTCGGSGRGPDIEPFGTSGIKLPGVCTDCLGSGYMQIARECEECKKPTRCDCRCSPVHNRKCRVNECDGTVCLSPELNDYDPNCQYCNEGIFIKQVGVKYYCSECSGKGHIPLTSGEIEELANGDVHGMMCAYTFVDKDIFSKLTFKGSKCKLVPWEEK